ncbi:MAG TPA: FtsQ-type POTRA domain-containing protein [Gaiellaceae bacterium]|nr:FtsQ-type POTRA domain-containing protein [Gaiellaceae bacterium]
MPRVEAVALPWRPSRPRIHPRSWVVRIVPTPRSLVIGSALAALALCGYAIARETSLFAIDRIDVQGGSPRIAAQVRQALASLVGKPLVGLDGSAVVRDVDALPTVVRASYDRAFPHTLRVTIVPERPAAVLRSGARSWLVSIRGRVMQPLSPTADPRLPRVWVSGRTAVGVGAILAAAQARVAVRAVGLAGAFGSRIGTATYADGALVFHLRSGLELLLGSPNDVKLKVAVAARALAMVPSGSTFLDVSVPGRTVSGIGSPGVPTPQGSSRG